MMFLPLVGWLWLGDGKGGRQVIVQLACCFSSMRNPHYLVIQNQSDITAMCEGRCYNFETWFHVHPRSWSSLRQVVPFAVVAVCSSCHSCYLGLIKTFPDDSQGILILLEDHPELLYYPPSSWRPKRFFRFHTRFAPLTRLSGISWWRPVFSAAVDAGNYLVCELSCPER